MTADPSTAQPSLRVWLFVSFFEPGFRGGGPIRSIASVASSWTTGIDLSIVTRDRDLADEHSYAGLAGAWAQRERYDVLYLTVHSPRQWVRLWRSLRASPPDLVYLNSLFDRPLSIVPALAVRLGLVGRPRLLVAPRGELSPGALAIKPRRKEIFLKVWRPVVRSLHASFHATNEIEATEIREAFPGAPVRVVMEEAVLPEQPMEPTTHAGSPRWTFIGRISGKKRLDLALAALSQLRFPVEFDIFGPIEDRELWARCTDLIAQLPDHVRVSYRGEIPHSEVVRTFNKYDAFVFPTAGENFAHVIAESLAAACPVICSGETPWSSILKAGGGLVVEPTSVENLAAALASAASWSQDERTASRQSAADAYSEWRAAPKPNVLDVFLNDPW